MPEPAQNRHISDNDSYSADEASEEDGDVTREVDRMTDDMDVNWISAEAITPLARGEKNISSSKILETADEAYQREMEEIAEAKVSSILRILSKVIFTEAL